MDPNLQEIKSAIQNIVTTARKQGREVSLTPHAIRLETEQCLGLPEGTLNTTVYKNAMKQFALATLAGVDSSGNSSIENQQEAIAGISEVMLDTPKTARKPQPKTVKKPISGEGKDAKVRKDSKVKRPFKSVAIIETSDEDDGQNEASTSELKSTRTPPKKRRKTVAPNSQKQSIELEPKLKSKHSESIVKPGSSRTPAPVEHKEEEIDKSESEMSVLIDATPVKRKTKKGDTAPTKTRKTTKEKKTRKPGTVQSKDEASVQRLKTYVTACGVRKVWSKEFQDLERPSQQIKRLKEILEELGMGGRPSMEKARSIKEKRALAKELEEIRSFEQAVSGQSSRIRSGRKGNTGSGHEEDGNLSNEFSDDVPVKHTNTARKSIMAFLGDDSDDE